MLSEDDQHLFAVSRIRNADAQPSLGMIIFYSIGVGSGAQDDAQKREKPREVVRQSSATASLYFTQEGSNQHAINRQR
jgi:hypothetical protein